MIIFRTKQNKKLTTPRIFIFLLFFFHCRIVQALTNEPKWKWKYKTSNETMRIINKWPWNSKENVVQWLKYGFWYCDGCILWCNKFPFYFSKLVRCSFHLTVYLNNTKKKFEYHYLLLYILFYIYVFVFSSSFQVIFFFGKLYVVCCDSGLNSHETALVTKRKMKFVFFFSILFMKTTSSLN